MRVDARHERCPRCGEVKPRTHAHFYFQADGRVNGYCRLCRRDYYRAYCYRPNPAQKAAHRLVVREWTRRARGVTPDRYRPARYAENQPGGEA